MLLKLNASPIDRGTKERATVSNIILKLLQVSLVCGSCTAGAAYTAVMPSHCVILEEIGSLYLAGPPLVKVLEFCYYINSSLYLAGTHLFKGIIAPPPPPPPLICFAINNNWETIII